MTAGPLLHFTPASNLASILASGELIPGNQHLGVLPIPQALIDAHRSVCFTDTPLEGSLKLALRHGRWGIAIKREALLSAGARKVKYLDEDETAERLSAQRRHRQSLSAPIWTDSPFLSPTLPTYDFQWEREWRHQGTFRFDWDSVDYLISPEGKRQQLVPEEALGHVYRYNDRSTGQDDLCWEDGGSEPFNVVMRTVVETLLTGYENPLDSLSYDHEDETGFNWAGLTKVDAYEIVEEALPVAPIRVIDSLAADLDSQAQYWIRSSEWDDYHL